MGHEHAGAPNNVFEYLAAEQLGSGLQLSPASQNQINFNYLCLPAKSKEESCCWTAYRVPAEQCNMPDTRVLLQYHQTWPLVPPAIFELAQVLNALTDDRYRVWLIWLLSCKPAWRQLWMFCKLTLKAWTRPHGKLTVCTLDRPSFTFAVTLQWHSIIRILTALQICSSQFVRHLHALKKACAYESYLSCCWTAICLPILTSAS